MAVGLASYGKCVFSTKLTREQLLGRRYRKFIDVETLSRTIDQCSSSKLGCLPSDGKNKVADGFFEMKLRSGNRHDLISKFDFELRLPSVHRIPASECESSNFANPPNFASFRETVQEYLLEGPFLQLSCFGVFSPRVVGWLWNNQTPCKTAFVASDMSTCMSLRSEMGLPKYWDASNPVSVNRWAWSIKFKVA
jgi:hypothetical protein